MPWRLSSGAPPCGGRFADGHVRPVAPAEMAGISERGRTRQPTRVNPRRKPAWFCSVLPAGSYSAFDMNAKRGRTVGSELTSRAARNGRDRPVNLSKGVREKRISALLARNRRTSGARQSPVARLRRRVGLGLAGDRGKPNRRDATMLARLHRVGALPPVFVPAADHAAMRGLIRPLRAVRPIAPRARQPLQGFPRRHGRKQGRATGWRMAYSTSRSNGLI